MGKFKGLRLLLLLVVLFLGIPKTYLAQQETTAGINGTIRDPSGAVIPGAQISLKNVDTGVQRSTASNDTGTYVIVNILPGRYDLAVSKAGFQTTLTQGISLAVNQATTYDFTLSIGAATQTITVQGSAASLQTSSADLGTAVTSQSIDNLPLNGRNFTQLLNLTTGVSPVNSSQSGSGWRTNAYGEFSFPSVNGQFNRSNTWLLDGVSNTEAITGSVTVTPILDDIKEFKVDSHNDQAQFGGATGGVMNVVTKSGTNALHGGAWEFVRNSGLDARNPFFTTVNPLRENQFGANIGGPVILPHYNGRNRTFFFGSYEGYRQHRASNTLYRVPTATELSGNLSDLGVPIYNPFSTQPDPNHPGQLLRTEFPNATITPSLIDPNMVKYAGLVFPTPVSTGVAGLNGLDTTPAIHDADTYFIRVDEQINSSNSAWFHFNHQKSPTSGSGGYKGLLTGQSYYGYNLGLSWLHTFGPSAVLQVLFGRNIGSVGPTTVFVGGNVPQILSETGFASGFVGGFTHGLPGRTFMLPSMGISGFVGGGENNGTPNVNSDTSEWKVNFSKVIGRHTLTAGANFDTNNQGAAASAGPSLDFSAFQTSNLEAPSGVTTGSPLASFLLGVPTDGRWDNVLNYEHGGWVDGFYVQDQWKVSDRFTVNLGLRYDFTLFPIIATKDKGPYYGITDVDNGTYIMESSVPACSATVFAPCLPSGVLPANVVVSPNGKLYQNDYGDIQPRVGLAYRLGSHNVIRASYGRVYDNWASVDQSAQNTQSWPTVNDVMAQNLNSGLPTISAENPFQGFTGPYPAPSPFTQLGWNNAPKFRAPYADEWNFGVQHMLGSSTVVTANYVGSKDSRTDISIMGNTAVTPGPGTIASRAPFPYMTPTFVDKSIGRASYNGFQFEVRRTASKGLTFLVSYTYSKAMDIGEDGWYCAEGCSIENMYDLNASKSVTGYDLTHVLTAAWVYQIPVGKGRSFNSGSRFLNYVIGDWDLNGILTLSSGLPYNATACGDIANTGNGGCYERANLVGNPSISNPSPTLWLNPAAFAVPAAYTFGNEGRNDLRADWFKNLDFSIFREFPISESKRFEFRVESFNLTNTPTWGIPNATINQPLFGKITSTRSIEREIQFALKFYF